MASTIEGLKQKRAPLHIQIGILVLPAGTESACGILLNVFQYLDIRSLCNVKQSSLIQLCRKAFGSDDFERVRDIALSLSYEGRRSINEDDMTLKDMVSQVSTDSDGYEYTPLMAAAKNEHFQLVQYLIEQGEADPNIVNSNGWNAVHYAARFNRTNTELIELLLTHISLDSINKKDVFMGYTPLDDAYYNNHSPIRQEIIALLQIIALLRLKGGKANCHDENGRNVGVGNGDLNH
eukprot:g3013.t1